jgi:GNAT superfamily N-acetyltransferase
MRNAEPTPGTGTIVVRPFAAGDRDRLRWIFLVSRKFAFHWLADKHYALSDFDAATVGEDIWVAEADGEISGFASVWAADSFIHNLFVDPALAGRGVGRALLATLAGCYPLPLTLRCLVRNEPALAFYRRLGWRTDGRGTGSDGDYFDLSFAP